MTEIEIAAGAAIAAQNSASAAYRRLQNDVQYSAAGSRHRTCANVNLSKLHESVSLIEKAVRLMLDARDRQARMTEQDLPPRLEDDGFEPICR